MAGLREMGTGVEGAGRDPAPVRKGGFWTEGQGSLPAVADILLMAVVYMLAGVIPAPSGIGSLEFVFWLFFSPSVGGQAAISAILVFRFATWFMPFVMGAVLVTARELFPR